MALAYLTINLDAFTGDDHPPVPSYSTITLDPGADHIDAAADVIHVRTIVVSLDRQGKAATANGVPCVDGKVPVVAGVAYAVSAPNVLRGGPHYIPALTAGQVVDLSDYITPGAPLTPDQAAALAARVTALEATPPGSGDTGPRDISSLINATTAPDLYVGGHEATIRRIGPVVFLTFWVWSKPGAGSILRIIEGLIPVGFQPPGYQILVPAADASIPADLALTAVLSGAASGNGNVYLLQNRFNIADGQQWAVVTSYATPDAWPSTYPGTAI